MGIHMAGQGRCAGREQREGLELGYCKSGAGEGSGGNKGVQGKEPDWTWSWDSFYFLPALTAGGNAPSIHLCLPP